LEHIFSCWQFQAVTAFALKSFLWYLTSELNML
jgi:hypothetical protein